jgi:hypothetical protein
MAIRDTAARAREVYRDVHFPPVPTTEELVGMDFSGLPEESWPPLIDSTITGGHALGLSSSGDQFVNHWQDILLDSPPRPREDFPYPRTVTEALRSLQAALHIPADGIYGPITEEALRGNRVANYRYGRTTESEAGLDHLNDIEGQTGVMVTDLRGHRIGHITRVDRRYDARAGYNTYTIEVIVPQETLVSYAMNTTSEPVPDEPPPIIIPENHSSLQRRELPQW